MDVLAGQKRPIRHQMRAFQASVWDACDVSRDVLWRTWCPNERLRAAMLESRHSVTRLAEELSVDPKTIHRWLGGRVPHPRHRFALASALSQEEEYLWPSVNRSTPNSDASVAELVAAYPFRADVDAAHWWSMIIKARQQIDLLGYTLYFLPQQHPQLIPGFKRSAQQAAPCDWS